jgi:hypothetical protein
MNCSEYEALLARDLEGELSPEERVRADAHLAECQACWALRDELIDISRAAAALPAMSPSRDLWHGIAARIDAPVVALPAAATRGGARRRTFRFAAAAAALMMVTAGATYVITRATFDERPNRELATAAGTESPTGGAGGTDDAQLVAGSLTAPGEAAFARELARLRDLLEQRRPDLDSSTVALLERNLAIIDLAITESREALARDPGSTLLNRQLQNALGKKVQVLRTAALLSSGAD